MNYPPARKRIPAPLEIGKIYGTCTVPSIPVVILGGPRGGNNDYKGALLRAWDAERYGYPREVGVPGWRYGEGLYEWFGALTDEEWVLATRLMLTEIE